MLLSSLKKRSIFLAILLSLFQINIPCFAVTFPGKIHTNALRPASSRVDSRNSIITAGDITKTASSDNAIPRTELTGKNPQAYLSPEFTDDEWKEILAQLGGSIACASMEGIMPELGAYALQASKGGLGILAGGKGEGYKKSVWNACISGVKAFLNLPMNEYMVIPKTNLGGRYQYLENEKVPYKKLIDHDNPIDYRAFTKHRRFDFPELEDNPLKPIKILADENGKQLKFKVNLFNERSGRHEDFEAALYCINRGGTPTFLTAQLAINNILYTDNVSERLNQQLLLGKVIPMLYKKFGIKPAVFHANEAHTVIAMAEMIQDEYFKDTAFVFTNHTPVAAGLQIYHDKAHWFSRLEIPDVFEDKDRNLRIDFKAVFTNGNNLDFSRAAMILAHLANGVSNAHGITLQKMFPDFKDKIRAILNGTDEIWKSDNLTEAEKRQEDISPMALWNIHQKDKVAMANLIKKRTGREINLHEPVAMAIRRIVFYKQQHPMLKDILKALCQDKGVKTKVVIDGKEEELEGLGMQVVVGGIMVDEHDPLLKHWVYEFMNWMDDPDFKGRFIFISGNDFELMRSVANGCDCWFEVPRRDPDTGDQEEACGTSGMRAAICGNPPITSSGMWGDEFIDEYAPKTNKGNGFILTDITPKELYKAFSVISGLYYDFMNKGDTGLLDFRKQVYEDAKVLYIENMIKRYILELFLPAMRCKKTEDAIRQTARFSLLPGKGGKIEQGEEMDIAVTISLKDPSLIDGIKAYVWTDINSPGSWHDVNMDVSEVGSKRGGKIFEFKQTITPKTTGDFYYKVKFTVRENGRNIYLPQRYGDDIRITVVLPCEKPASKQNLVPAADGIELAIQSAA